MQSEGIELTNGETKSLEDEKGISIWVCYNLILWKVKKWKIWWQRNTSKGQVLIKWDSTVILCGDMNIDITIQCTDYIVIF